MVDVEKWLYETRFDNNSYHYGMKWVINETTVNGNLHKELLVVIRGKKELVAYLNSNNYPTIVNESMLQKLSILINKNENT